MWPPFRQALLKGILIPLLGLFLVSKYNLVYKFNFIPEDYKFEAGLGFYLIGLEWVFLLIQFVWEKYCCAEISLIFYKAEREINIDDDPTYELNTDCARVKCKLSVQGRSWYLKDVKINIALPSIITGQVPTEVNYMSCSDGKNCVINLSSLASYSSPNVFYVNFSVICDVPGHSCNVTIEPTIIASVFHKIFIRFKHNGSKISNSTNS